MLSIVDMNEIATLNPLMSQAPAGCSVDVGMVRIKGVNRITDLSALGRIRNAGLTVSKSTFW